MYDLCNSSAAWAVRTIDGEVDVCKALVLLGCVCDINFLINIGYHRLQHSVFLVVNKNETTRLEMTPQFGSADGRKGQTGAYKDKSKPVDIRSSNINAAKGKSAVRSAFLLCSLIVLHQDVEYNYECNRPNIV